MRELKFRVWCEDRKEMLDIQRHSFKTGKSMPYGWKMQYEFDAITQYTGLKDKNSKEIYEGDILEYETGYRDSVMYDEGCFWAAGSKSCDYLYGSLKWEPIVVGNIYENRELLNDEDLRILGIEA